MEKNIVRAIWFAAGYGAGAHVLALKIDLLLIAVLSTLLLSMRLIECEA